MSAPTTMQVPGFRGDVIVPDHHDYDDARAVWNGTRRPTTSADCPLQRHRGVRRRDRDRPVGDARRLGRSCRAHGPGPGRCPVGRCRPRDTGARSGDHGRHRGPHRRRRPQPGRRPRLAHAQARAHRRQPRPGRGGHRRGRDRGGVGQRSPRPVLGPARRRRELRHRQLVPVRAAPGRPHRHGRTGVLGGRGHHRRPALLP